MFTTIQVHVIVANDNEIRHLALKRSENCKLYPTMWQTITGTVEKNEHAYEAAVRELKEEAGLESNNWFKIPFLGGFYDLKRNLVESVPSFAVIYNSFVDIRISDEHSEYSWIKSPELEDYFPIPDHINGALQVEKLMSNPQQLRVFSI